MYIYIHMVQPMATHKHPICEEWLILYLTDMFPQQLWLGNLWQAITSHNNSHNNSHNKPQETIVLAPFLFSPLLPVLLSTNLEVPDLRCPARSEWWAPEDRRLTWLVPVGGHHGMTKVSPWVIPWVIPWYKPNKNRSTKYQDLGLINRKWSEHHEHNCWFFAAEMVVWPTMNCGMRTGTGMTARKHGFLHIPHVLPDGRTVRSLLDPLTFGTQLSKFQMIGGCITRSLGCQPVNEHGHSQTLERPGKRLP